MTVPLPKHPSFINLQGRVFGKLTAKHYAGRNHRGESIWLCQCDCGNETTPTTKILLKGATKSCGCIVINALVERSRKHGHASGGKCSQEYNSHKAMLDRCRDAERPNYGMAGIKVCDRWVNGADGLGGFECFIADMGPKPSDKHSIDRLNVNGDYEPKNCRWATATQQIRNRTNTRYVVYNGDRMALGDAAEKAGLPYTTVLQRLAKGWSADKALGTPRETKYLRKPLKAA